MLYISAFCVRAHRGDGKILYMNFSLSHFCISDSKKCIFPIVIFPIVIFPIVIFPIVKVVYAYDHSLLTAVDHTTSKARDPIRTPQLSDVRPG